MTDRIDPDYGVCTGCGKPIAADEKNVAHGPDGNMHYRCFKVGTAHGREVVLPRCPNCNAPLFRGATTCDQCGVGPQIGAE